MGEILGGKGLAGLFIGDEMENSTSGLFNGDFPMLRWRPPLSTHQVMMLETIGGVALYAWDASKRLKLNFRELKELKMKNKDKSKGKNGARETGWDECRQV